MFLRRSLLLASLLLIASLSSAAPAAGQNPAAPAKPPILSVESIMRGPELVGTEPSIVGWSADGQKFYFRWKKPEEKAAELYFITPKNFAPQKAAADELQKTPLAAASGGGGFRGYFGGGASMIPDKAKKRFILNQGGDLALLDAAAGKTTPLLRTDDRESAVAFTADEKGIVFTAEDNLYVLSLDGLGLRQMTSFSRAPAARASGQARRRRQMVPGPANGAFPAVQAGPGKPRPARRGWAAFRPAAPAADRPVRGAVPSI